MEPSLSLMLLKFVLRLAILSACVAIGALVVATVLLIGRVR